MALVVLVLVPPDSAHALARALVQEKLAASVNILGGVQTVYRWQGEVAEDPESVLLIKTSEARYPELEARIKDLHSYEIPEIIALDVDRGYPPFLEWLTEHTTD
jgi:periplasmic divalent cation tolerance protein